VFFAFVGALHIKERTVLRIVWNPLGQLEDEEVVVLRKATLSLAGVTGEFR